jgi:hypothetical protein
MSRRQSIHRLDRLLDRLPVSYLRKARSVVNGVIPVIVAIVASAITSWCVEAFCVPIAAGLAYVVVAGAAAGVAAVCAVGLGTIAASSLLTRAVSRREPLFGPLLGIVNDVTAAIGANSPEANGILAAVNGTLKAIFQPICERHAVKTPAATPARSSGPVVKGFK